MENEQSKPEKNDSDPIDFDIDQWQVRMNRALLILDQWIDLFEENMKDANPDPSKSSELANIFTILRRLLEIKQIQHKLKALEEANEYGEDKGTETSDLLDPELFGQGIPFSSD